MRNLWSVGFSVEEIRSRFTRFPVVWSTVSFAVKRETWKHLPDPPLGEVIRLDFPADCSTPGA